jgi:hypothetical protein
MTKPESKSQPSWTDVKVKLAAFDRTALLDLLRLPALSLASQDLPAFTHHFLRCAFDAGIPFAGALLFFPDFAFFSTRSFHAVRNAPSSTSSLAIPSTMCLGK